jgi:hypothetical protein
MHPPVSVNQRVARTKDHTELADNLVLAAATHGCRQSKLNKIQTLLAILLTWLESVFESAPGAAQVMDTHSKRALSLKVVWFGAI